MVAQATIAAERAVAARWFFDWQGLLSALVAIVLVLVTAWYVRLTKQAIAQTSEALQLERRGWTADIEDRQRWQAQLISLQFVRSPEQARWNIHNDSATSIQNVEAFSVVNHEVAWVNQPLLIIRPGGLGDPGEDARFPDLPLANIGIRFRDNAGRWWAKWADGDLQPLGHNQDADLLAHATNP